MIFEEGHQTRDFVHVSDIVQGARRALGTDRADYQAVNLGTGRPTSVLELARLIARGLSKDIEPDISGKYREGDVRHCYADISRARELLGYSPKMALEDGMRDLLEWVRGQETTDLVDEAVAELKSHNLIR